MDELLNLGQGAPVVRDAFKFSISKNVDTKKYEFSFQILMPIE